MIGLKRGTVKLCEHEKAWEKEAQDTISRLKQILRNGIKDIQHVGSTSIQSIKAKPIIDIALAVDDFDDILGFEKELKDAGFYYRPNAQVTIKISCYLLVVIFMKVQEICKLISSMLSVQIV